LGSRFIFAKNSRTIFCILIWIPKIVNNFFNKTFGSLNFLLYISKVIRNKDMIPILKHKKMNILFENWDSDKNDYVNQKIDLSNEPTFKDFISKNKLSKYLSKVGNITLDNKLKCGYRVSILDKLKKENQWAYVLLINGKIVKFGDTTKTLSNRWSSYSAGIKENRNRGTCSTTNYFISEVIRRALNDGMNVELWGYNIPTLFQTIDVFGETETAIIDVVTYYESKLLKLYQTTYNKLPILGKNGLTK
jgi:hypothetical protein